MTETTPCEARVLALHALVDGELDPLAALELETHLRGCAACRAGLAQIEATRAALAGAALRSPAPPHLRRRIMARHAKPAPLRPLPWLGGATLGALAASVALLVAVPGGEDPAAEMVDAQIRSLQAGHLIDVQKSDRHTVKPWFNGRVTFAPPVADLAARGFPLVGGRLDVIARENVAVLVYRRRAHTINLFVRPTGAFGWSDRSGGSRAGYTVLRWQRRGLDFGAVSDLDPAELRQFEAEFVAATG